MRTVEGFALLFESVTVTIKSEVDIALDVEAAEVEVVNVTGDGVNDELDCSSTGVGVGVEIDVDVSGVELDAGVSDGKENEVEDGVDIGTEITVNCQYLSC